MAFLRRYAEQGDPSPSSMRAGRLMSRRRFGRRAGGAMHSRMSHADALRILRTSSAYQGDPFRFRMPKFVRKLSLKKVVAGVSKLARVALPVALPFIGGPLGMVAGALAGGRAGAGSPDEPSPELTYNPPYQGTVGEQMRQPYEVPGIEVEADRYQPDEDEDDYSDVDDAGEEFYDEEEE